MSLARFGSNLTLPQSNYAALNVAFAADGVAQTPNGTTATVVQRAILEVGGTGSVTVLANDGTTVIKTLATGSEWILESGPGSTFDLNWFKFKTTAHTTQTFVILYQP